MDTEERHIRQKGSPAMAGTYIARIVDVHGEGVRLEPTAGSEVPERPNDVNLLAMAIALALGAAAYEHHPETRNPEIQTLEALLTGEATMPWRGGPAGTGTASPHVVCERSGSGAPRCRVQSGPGAP
jgi:hypothetical protein